MRRVIAAWGAAPAVCLFFCQLSVSEAFVFRPLLRHQASRRNEGRLTELYASEGAGGKESSKWADLTVTASSNSKFARKSNNVIKNDLSLLPKDLQDKMQKAGNKPWLPTREMICMDLYGELGLLLDAPKEEVVKAYNLLSMELLVLDQVPEVIEKRRRVRIAYLILSNDRRRKTWEDIKFAYEKRPKVLFVDEPNCIGCLQCNNWAPKTFGVDFDEGKARVIDQDGHDVETTQVAVDVCPAECIHWVEGNRLPYLEQVIRTLPVTPAWLWNMPGFSVTDVFKLANDLKMAEEYRQKEAEEWMKKMREEAEREEREERLRGKVKEAEDEASWDEEQAWAEEEMREREEREQREREQARREEEARENERDNERELVEVGARESSMEEGGDDNSHLHQDVHMHHHHHHHDHDHHHHDHEEGDHHHHDHESEGEGGSGEADGGSSLSSSSAVAGSLREFFERGSDSERENRQVEVQRMWSFWQHKNLAARKATASAPERNWKLKESPLPVLVPPPHQSQEESLPSTVLKSTNREQGEGEAAEVPRA
mmetsp:Transcript_41641/g.82161  ORF Transcript_41641/g.82161 Transcript_41641/m.82161 type:complete len:543 (-) Transcript_41641:925-2553(-)